MRRFSLIHFALAAIAAMAVFGSPDAHAQNPQSWVASNGTGTACSRSAPCLSFIAAYNATLAGGEINCVDNGNFGSLINITHSITVNCIGTIGQMNVRTVNITTAAMDVVVLKGLDLDFDGLVDNGPPLGLINFNGAGVLQVENMRIHNTKGSTYNGINFIPTGPAKLIVADSAFTKIGTAGTTAGIYIKPSSGVTADVSIERSRIDGNFFGIVADGTGGGIIRALVKDSFVTNNVQNGITVSTTGSSTVLTVDNTGISGNNHGLVAGGSGAGMLVGRSVITGNATGLFTTGGGVLLSYKDNRLNANPTGDGAFTGVVGTQ